VSSATEVATMSLILDAIEPPAGIEPGTIDIQVLFETAPGIENAYEILRASPRVRSFFGGVARDGDVNRAIGLRWTKEGRESLYLRSKLLLAGRAAGAPYPVSGTWIDLDDLDGLREYAIECRDLGYTGMYVIHPSHVEIANDVFTPTADEVARAHKIVAEIDRAEKEGLGAVRFEGAMIDIAMAAGSREVLAFVEELNSGE
jgi:citrate lyase subunit beta/citryl-CoA lyase